VEYRQLGNNPIVGAEFTLKQNCIAREVLFSLSSATRMTDAGKLMNGLPLLSGR
jgi:hypothetical protein